MSRWNNRIVRFRKLDIFGREQEYLGVFEVFYNDEGIPYARTQEQVTPYCADKYDDDGAQSIIQSVRRILSDLEKYPILDDTEINGKPSWEEKEEGE